MRVLAHVNGAVNPVSSPVVADGLGNGQDMGLGKRAVEGGPPVSTGAEADKLVGIAQIGLAPIVFLLELGDVDQHLFGGRFTRQWVNRHGLSLSRCQ